MSAHFGRDRLAAAAFAFNPTYPNSRNTRETVERVLRAVFRDATFDWVEPEKPGDPNEPGHFGDGDGRG